MYIKNKIIRSYTIKFKQISKNLYAGGNSNLLYVFNLK